MTAEAEIIDVRAENAALREQLAAALAEVQELKARLAKDSHNISKPSSSNGLKRQFPRTCSETLALVAEPDVVTEQECLFTLPRQKTPPVAMASTRSSRQE